MKRITFAVFALVSLVWFSAAMGPQSTTMSDCDKWIAAIHAEAGNRVDDAGWTARQKVEDITRRRPTVRSPT